MRGYVLSTIFVIVAPGLAAQDFTLSASQESGLPGTSISALVLLGNSEPVRGFSFGMSHDSSDLTLLDIGQGSVVASLNGGEGADFFFVDTEPVGGLGGTVHCIISLQAPIEEIPSGTDQEIALFDYEIGTGAVPGAEVALAFTDGLGSPPVDVGVDVAGTSYNPIPGLGLITIETPPVDGLTCTITDESTCEVLLSWANPSAYQAIRILENGRIVSTLLGTETAFVHTIDSTVILGVIAVGLLQQASEMRICVGDCAAPLADFSVSATQGSVPLEVNFTDLSTGAIGSYVWNFGDGSNSPDQNPTHTYTTEGSYTVSLTVTGPAGTDTETRVDYISVNPDSVSFLRGDADADGVSNTLPDSLFILGFAFVPGSPPPICWESADTDGDGVFNGLLDTIFLLNFGFIPGSSPIPPPFPECGPDPEPATSLGCDANACS